jgi:hypothetical protein
MSNVEESILNSINKNGYPQKKVSLPFQPIFQACKNQDTSLSKVLKNLEAQDVLNEMKDDKIVFYDRNFISKRPGPDPYDIPEDLLKEASERLKSMDPAEVERMKKKVMEMSPEERENMMKQAKDLFGQKKP